MLNVPNLLTIARILSIPVLLILLTERRFGQALLVFVLAGLTDSLDGAVARFMNSRTTLGAYLDPLADKTLILSSFALLAILGEVPAWLTVLVWSRDIIILTGYLLLFVMTQRLMNIHPSVLSKAATFLDLCSLALVLVRLYRPGASSDGLINTVFLLAAAFTIASGLQYIGRGLRWYQAVSSSFHASVSH